MLLDQLAAGLHLGLRRGDLRLTFGQPHAPLFDLFAESLEMVDRLFQFAGDLPGPIGEFVLLILQADEVGFEFLLAGQVVTARRVETGNRFAVLGLNPLGLAERIFRRRETGIGLALPGFVVVRLGREQFAVCGQGGLAGLVVVEFGADPPDFVRRQPQPQHAQFVGQVPIPRRAAGLRADVVPLLFDFLNDVAQSKQVLRDAL